MSFLSALGKGLYTTARIADAGVSVYQLVDDAWLMIDPDSRHPENKALMKQLVEVGQQYDEKLEKLLVRANNLNNLSNSLYTLNGTVQLVDDKGVAIFARYEKLAHYRESFDLKFPTLRNWFNESWMRKHNIQPQQYQQLTSQANPSTLSIVMSAGLTTFGAAMTAIKIKGLVSMGLDAYRRYKGTMPTRPRSNAIVAPTGRIARLQHQWMRLTIRYPRIYAGLQAGAVAGTLGMNIYMIIEKVKRADSQKDALQKQIALTKESDHYLELFQHGAKTAQELEELVKHYQLPVEQKNADELKLGIDGLLDNYNENLACCLKLIDDTFNQLDEDAVVVTPEDQAQQDAIRRDRARCKEAIEAIHSDTNGDTRKEKIVKFSEFTRDTLVKRFDEWIAALDAVLEIENIRTLIAQEAVFLVEDLADVAPSKWPERIARQATRTFSSVNATLPGRKVFLKEEDVRLLLAHFVEELTKQHQAA